MLVRLFIFMSCYAMLGHVRPLYEMLGYISPVYARLGQVRSCLDRLGHVRIGYVWLCQSRSG